MTAALVWVRIDLRRRARSLIVLTVLVALTTAVVLAAVAGARRGQTVVARLIDQTEPATLAVLPNEPGFDWDAVAAIDGVVGLSQFPLSAFAVEGVPEHSVSFVFDEQAMHTVERPVVLEGRLADPARDDEAVITANFEGTYGKSVGDHVTFHLFTPEQIDAIALSDEESVDPEGPEIDAEIVGVVRSPWFSDFGDTTDGAVVPSAGVLAKHRDNFVGTQGEVWFNALVRLEDGADGTSAFRERLAEVSGRHDIEFFNLAEDAQHARDVSDFEGNGLLVFALAAGIAALFLVGQSVVRYVAGATPELEVLRAIGMSPRHVRWLASVGPTLAAVVGSLVGATIAWLASSWFPIGTVEPLEPAPGRDLDIAILGSGVLMVILLMSGGALVASWMATRSYLHPGIGRPSRLASLAARAGAPVPTAIGARFALERGAGSNAVPILPAIVGSVVGVLGIVAALTFADGVDDATSHPERFGVFAQLELYAGFNGEDLVSTEDVGPTIAAVKGVAAVNDNRSGVTEVGAVDVTLFTVDPVTAPPPVVLTDGQMPATADEVALAPTSADDIGAEVGDTIEMSGVNGPTEVVITGLAFVPEGPHNAYDEGAWVTSDGFDELADAFKFHFFDITVRGGEDLTEVAARVDAEVAKALELPEGTELVSPRVPPSRLNELKEISRLPLYLAAFLALLAVTAVGHAVATAVRRRRHDLAVLRAIGLTRGQTRRIALVQATVLASIGLIVGVPLGVAAGRSLWASVANNTPVLHIAPLAVLALLLITPVAIGTANVLAAWPSQRAARLRVGQILRTE